MGCTQGARRVVGALVHDACMHIGAVVMIDKSDAVAASRDRRAAERARFGARVAELRNQAGLNQTEVAAAAGMSRVTLSQLENGKTDLAVTFVPALATALGVEPGELFKVN